MNAPVTTAVLNSATGVVGKSNIHESARAQVLG